MAMLLYPETLKKAQQEIDIVVGTDRLPTMSDRKSLPYSKRARSFESKASYIGVLSVQAIVNETLRWGVPVPLSEHFLILVTLRTTIDNSSRSTS